MPPESSEPAALAQAVSEVAERAQVLVREEIELAKAELTAKLTSLAKGAAVGAAAGLFVILGFFKLLDAASWGVWRLVEGGGGINFWAGFLIVALVLFVLGAIAGFIASRLVKRGVPPTPTMAIEEAQLIRETVGKRGSTTTPTEDRS